MRRLILLHLLLIFGTVGCATARSSSEGTMEATLQASLDERDAQVAALEQTHAELTARDRRLQAELALARADAREARAELQMRRQTHSIGRVPAPDDGGGWIEQDGFSAHTTTRSQDALTDSGDAEVESEEMAAPAVASDSGPRPVLRLYGDPVASLPVGRDVLPASTATSAVFAPARTARLTVAAVSAAPSTPRAAPNDAAVAEYREALAMVRDRRLDAALPALERFVAAHPNHPYADNALYWRGEVFFLRHQFPQALREYTRLMSNYPRGNKVADALLRSGICHLRMGDSSRARASFRRLRESFPQSVAARRASREDAS